MNVALACVGVLAGLCAGALAWHAANRLLKLRFPGEALQVAARPVTCAVLLAVACGTLGARCQDALELAQYVALAAVLVTCSLTDLAAWLIPNECIAAAVGIRLCYLLAVGLARGWAVVAPLARESAVGLVAVVLALGAMVLLMDHLMGTESMGGGDLKLFGVAGIFFGWRRSVLLVLAACAFSVVFVLVRALMSRERDVTRAFPFGPFIAASCWLVALIGADVVAWYTQLLM